MVKTNGLIEVILFVQDMASQVAFYKEVFGLEVLYPAHATDLSGENWVTLDTGECILALHSGGKERLGAYAHKIVFGVDDIHVAREQLLAKGVEVGEVRPAAPGVWVCDGKDPEGNPFSIESHD